MFSEYSKDLFCTQGTQNLVRIYVNTPLDVKGELIMFIIGIIFGLKRMWPKNTLFDLSPSFILDHLDSQLVLTYFPLLDFVCDLPTIVEIHR